MLEVRELFQTELTDVQHHFLFLLCKDKERSSVQLSYFPGTCMRGCRHEDRDILGKHYK